MVPEKAFHMKNGSQMNMRNKERTYLLSKKQKEAVCLNLLDLIKSDRHIQFAYIFGSFTDETPIHDIDVGILVKDISKRKMTRFALELGGFLTENLKVPIDVRILNFAPIPFSFQVIQGKLIYAPDMEAHSEFVENIIRRYLDIKPVLTRAAREAYSQ